MTIKSHGGIFGRNPTFNIVTASQFIGPTSGFATSAAALKSSATTGLMQITGPAAGATRTMTIPDANFTAARTDAGQTFTGVQVMTSPNIVTSINDANGNELFGITATASAVNELTIANAATGSNPTISATGTDTNIGVTITPKGTGNLVLTGGNLVVANGKGIDFSATSDAAGATSELFDDYEEGTWTPVVGGLTTAGTYELQKAVGKYTKVGDLVTIEAFIQLAAAVTGGGAGNLGINGAPFVKPADAYPAAAAYVAGVTISETPIVVFSSFGAAPTLILQQNASGGFGTSVAITDVGVNDYISFSMTYKVA